MTQSNVNDSATNASTRTGSAQPRSGPVRYRLITPSGHGMGTFGTALEAASTAGGFWPGVGQKDDGREGWDIEVVRGE